MSRGRQKQFWMYSFSLRLLSTKRATLHHGKLSYPTMLQVVQQFLDRDVVLNVEASREAKSPAAIRGISLDHWAILAVRLCCNGVRDV